MKPMKIGWVLESDNDIISFEAERKAESSARVGDFVVVEEGERKILAQIQRLKYEDVSELPKHYRTARPETLSEYRDAYRLWGEAFTLVEINADGRIVLPRSPAEPTKELRFATEAEVKQLLQQITGKSTPLVVGKIDQQNAQLPFSIPMEKVIERHTAILGVTGSGKSTLVKRILYQLKVNEERLRNKFAIVVFDVHEEYEAFGKLEVPVVSLDKYLGLPHLTIPIAPLEADPNVLFGVLYPEAEASEQQRIFFDTLVDYAKENSLGICEAINQLYQSTFDTGKDGVAKRKDARVTVRSYTIPISRSTLDALKRRIDDLYRSVIFEEDGLPQWNRIQRMIDVEGGVAVIEFGKTALSDRVKAVQVIASYIINSRKQVAKPELAKKPFVWLVIEEAHNFLAQDAPTLGTLRMICQEGRKFRVGICAISQTPRRMDDITLSQCNSLIALRVINPKDQSTIRDSCAMVEERMIHRLPRLNVGQAYFSVADAFAPILVQIDNFTDSDLGTVKREEREKPPPVGELAKEF